MYGFGGLGEVEVEIWSDVTIAGQTTDKKERQGYSANGPWKAEMSKCCPNCVQGERVIFFWGSFPKNKDLLQVFKSTLNQMIVLNAYLFIYCVFGAVNADSGQTE